VGPHISASFRGSTTALLRRVKVPQGGRYMEYRNFPLGPLFVTMSKRGHPAGGENGVWLKTPIVILSSRDAQVTLPPGDETGAAEIPFNEVRGGRDRYPKGDRRPSMRTLHRHQRAPK